MARMDERQYQHVGFALHEDKVHEIAQAQRREGIASRADWIRAAIDAALERSEASK